MFLIKTIFILFLLFYLFTKIGGFLLKSVLGKVFSQYSSNQQAQARQQQRSSRHQQPVDGNVKIDHIPNDKGSQSNDMGGDYVDYEEVK